MIEPKQELIDSSDLNDRIIELLVANQEHAKRMFRRWLLACTLLILSAIGYQSWEGHDSRNIINQVRMTQMLNTVLSDTRQDCTTTGLHDLAYDLRLVVKPGETPAEFEKQIKIPASSKAC